MHGIKGGGMANCQSEMKKAVDCGYWNLFRYNPALKEEGKNPFILDSKAPTPGYQDFIKSAGHERRFEMEERYLALINGAERELLITMAYFSPLPRFMDAIVAACRRGVRVTVMIPERANFQNDTNRKTVRHLLQKTNNGITVLLSPKMLHTKLLISEKEISLGSTNITKKAFMQLDELNLFVPRADSDFCRALLASAAENRDVALPVLSYKDVSYRKSYAFFEGFLV